MLFNVYFYQFLAGTVSVNEVRQHQTQVYGDDLQHLLEELALMINKKAVADQRRKQIEIGCRLKDYVGGAQTIMQLKDMFKLTGDFSDLVKIVDAVSTIFIKSLELSEILSRFFW